VRNGGGRGGWIEAQQQSGVWAVEDGAAEGDSVAPDACETPAVRLSASTSPKEPFYIINIPPLASGFRLPPPPKKNTPREERENI